jgi:hypothetical protein
MVVSLEILFDLRYTPPPEEWCVASSLFLRLNAKRGTIKIHHRESEKCKQGVLVDL